MICNVKFNLARQLLCIAVVSVCAVTDLRAQDTAVKPETVKKPDAGDGAGEPASEAEPKIVRINKPTTYRSLIGDGKTVLVIINRGSITFDCQRGDVIRDVEIRNKTEKPQKVSIRGTNVRVDNLVVDGCTLHLDGLQNSTLTSLCVANSLGHGVLIDNATCNCELDGTFKRNAGYGVFIDSAQTRSIEIYGKPMEENKLGQVCVNAIDKHGSISLKGRLNSVAENGPPLTIKATEGRIHLQSFLDFRNMSGQPDIVQNPPGQRASLLRAGPGE